MELYEYIKNDSIIENVTITGFQFKKYEKENEYTIDFAKENDALLKVNVVEKENKVYIKINYNIWNDEIYERAEIFSDEIIKSIQLFYENLPKFRLRFAVGEKIIETDEPIRISKKIREALKFLREAERKVICLRYGLSSKGKNYTLAEIGEIIGYTTHFVRQIEIKALEKIEKHYEGNKEELTKFKLGE